MFPAAETLARTYDNPSYDDPWDAVLDYRRAMDAAATHPEKGSSALSRVVNLPRGRIRGWVEDGSAPDVVRGIQTATSYGWLNPDPNSRRALALVELAAHVMAGGSLESEWYVPAVSVGRRVDRAVIEDAFQAAGVRTSVRHDDADGRATELTPREDASVLGRCLVTMGVPKGSKRDVTMLPAVARNGSKLHRTLFATTYARHRAVEYDGKDTTRIMEERPQSYLKQLQTLFEDVTGERVTVDARGVTISGAAARQLGIAQPLVE